MMKSQEKKEGEQTMRKKIRKWALVLAAAALCAGTAGMTVPMQAMAAQETELMTVETTQRCSIWSAPATTEENRVKYVDAGYQITIYPEVIESEAGDGKTFYRTVKGSYVLCKCVTGGNETGAGSTGGAGAADGTASAGAGSAPWVSPADAAVPPSFHVASAYSKEIPSYVWGPSYGKIAWIREYDESGNVLKETSLDLDGNVRSYQVWEYDAAGNQIKVGYFDADGTLKEWRYKEDFDAYGYARKSTRYNADGVVQAWTYSEWNADESLKNSTTYYPDGCYTVTRLEQGLSLNATKKYFPDGSLIPWLDPHYLVH